MQQLKAIDLSPEIAEYHKLISRAAENCVSFSKAEYYEGDVQGSIVSVLTGLTTTTKVWVDEHEPITKQTSTPKHKFSRAKWFNFTCRRDVSAEILEWCSAQFGNQPTIADAWTRWQSKNNFQFSTTTWRQARGTTIQFRDEKDYQWFLLRWASSEF